MPASYDAEWREAKNDDNSYAAAQTGVDRPRSLSHRPGLHGHERNVRPDGRYGEPGDHPRGPRRGRQPAGYRRLLRHGPERDAARPGVALSAPAGGALGEVRRAEGSQRRVAGF